MTEMIELGGDGDEGRRDSTFGVNNPMFQPKSKSLFTSDIAGHEQEQPKAGELRTPYEGQPQESPLFSPPQNQSALKQNSQGLLSLGNDKGGLPPRSSTPLPSPTPPPAPKRSRCQWTRQWDESEKANYFENRGWENGVGIAGGRGVLGGWRGGMKKSKYFLSNVVLKVKV